jgi:two-component system nitrogen regulation response regulator GlnG
MAIKRILVADDEESIRWVLSKALSKQGYQVDLASNGEQALEMGRQKSYDLAVLDIKMPGLSGLDLLTRFQEERPETLVVIMTAESDRQAGRRTRGPRGLTPSTPPPRAPQSRLPSGTRSPS